MSKSYIRYANDLFKQTMIEWDRKTLLETVLNKPTIPHYMSVFKYTPEQMEQYLKTKSAAGMSGHATNSIIFDFDDKLNVKAALIDTRNMYLLLEELGYQKNDIQIYFSGHKGFHLVIDLEQQLEQSQLKNFVNNLRSKGTFNSFDTKVYDVQRMFRAPFSLNKSTGLFKTPISKHQLFNASLDEIKAQSKNILDSSINIVESYNYSAPLLGGKELLEPPVPVKPPKMAEIEIIGEDRPDFTQKTKELTEAKYALQMGFFEDGERNEAFEILAATYKYLGYPKEFAHRMLKATDELYVKRMQNKGIHKELKPKKAIWTENINHVYGPLYKGGTYSEKDNDLLQKTIQRYNIKQRESTHLDPTGIFDLGGDTFKKYAQSFYESRIYTGLKDLDEAFPICAGSNIGIVGASGAGKCLGKDTPIRMYDGSIKLSQDVKTGDLLMGDDSFPRKVLSITSGKETLYKIKQNNGMDYIVNESHILSLRCTASKKNHKKGKVYIYPGSKYSKGNVVDIPILEYINSSREFKKYFKGYFVPIEYPIKALKLDPYFIGLWIGDGCATKLSISKPDKEIHEYLKKLAEEYNYKVNNHSPNDTCPTWNITNSKGKKNIILDLMRDLDLMNNKHIPNDYLINSRNNRLLLLAGLLDSDGSYDQKRNSYEFSSKYEHISASVVELCRSLGFRATLSKNKAGCFYKNEYKESVRYRVYIAGEKLHEIPCLIPRKKAKVHNIKTDTLSSSLEIVNMGIGDYYGFEIDGNRRFLLGDYTVTHNTSVTLGILHEMKKTNAPSVFASLDMSRSRLYEKLLYKVTQGKYDRDFLYKEYLNGNGAKYDAMVKEEYPNVFIYSKSAANVHEIGEYIKNVEQHTGKAVRLLMIDYFERLGSSKSDDTAASKEVAMGIQDLISDFPMLTPITLLQPNKMSLGGGPETPILSYTNIKGSSALYQSLRQILSLWRPFCGPEYREWDKFMEMAILKNDLGDLDMFKYAWEGKTGNISMLTDEGKRKYDEYMAAKKQMDKEDEDDGNNNGKYNW